MKVMLTLFLLLNGMLSFSQIEKGDWLIRGAGVTLNQRVNNVDYTNINLEIALGYFISKQWLAGAGIGLAITERSTYVTNELFGRYYLKDSLSRRHLFVEARYERGEFALVGTGLSDQRYTARSAAVGFGIDFFLSERMALETQVTYYFFNQFNRFGEKNRITSDRLSFNASLQYFFRYRDFQVERLIDYRNVLSKGKWFLGGKFGIKEANQVRATFVQNIKPRIGLFILKNLTIGSELNYNATNLYQHINIGLNPFARYYVNIGRKKKLFAELSSGYTLGLIKETDYRKVHTLQYGGSIGLSNFINEEISFDISYSFSRSQSFRKFINTNFMTATGAGIDLGLQYFFRRKKS